MADIDMKKLRAEVRNANARLERLEKNHYVNWAYKLAPYDVEKQKRRFKVPKQLNERNLNALQKKLDRFLSAKSSTISGMEEIRETRVNSLLSNAGISETSVSEKEKLFISDFLSSRQFKELKKVADSGQVVENFIENIKDKDNPDDILYEYNQWINTGNTPFKEAFTNE